jgi:hypothetical protein
MTWCPATCETYTCCAREIGGDIGVVVLWCSLFVGLVVSASNVFKRR